MKKWRSLIFIPFSLPHFLVKEFREKRGNWITYSEWLISGAFFFLSFHPIPPSPGTHTHIHTHTIANAQMHIRQNCQLQKLVLCPTFALYGRKTQMNQGKRKKCILFHSRASLQLGSNQSFYPLEFLSVLSLSLSCSKGSTHFLSLEERNCTTERNPEKHFVLLLEENFKNKNNQKYPLEWWREKILF